MKRPIEAKAYITCGFTGAHAGIDYGTAYKPGMEVYAVEDGRVIVSQEQTQGYGRHIRILHEKAVSIYAHLSARMVQVGDVVKAGALIGLSGGCPGAPCAGNSSGCHLHFEYQRLVPVDPLPLMEDK